MNRKIVIAGLSGGLALFVWGVVAMTLSPLYQSSFRRLPGEDRVVTVLIETQTPHGVYVIPGFPGDPESPKESRAVAEQAWEEKTRRGPVAMLVYQPWGRSPTRMFLSMTRGLALCLLATFFSAWALSRATIARHFGRIAFVLGLGVFGWVLGHGMQWHWFGYPIDFTAATLVDALIGWSIVGVVQAGMVRTGPPKSAV